MTQKKIRPHMVFADADGNIYDDPELFMVCRRGNELTLPRPDELIKLPVGSDLYLLPSRKAVGFDEETGKIEVVEDMAVSAFVCPGFTLAASTAYVSDSCAPMLPLFAYGAVGFARDSFWITAQNVDLEPRQVFDGISNKTIKKNADELLAQFPKNRLMQHLGSCALKFCCPAAKNFALGRYEAPIPTSMQCNARCVGCISKQDDDSGIISPQNRITFRPSVEEIVELMRFHEQRAENPIYSFGQGCEGEPLTESNLLEESIAAFRALGGKGTININTNGSKPEVFSRLAQAGLSSIRVSINSFREECYNIYYRPRGYKFADVLESLKLAKKNGLFVSLNFLYFPGFSDMEEETESLANFLKEVPIDYIQLRNLCLDPELYLRLMKPWMGSIGMGLSNFMKRIMVASPKIRFGYFNPVVSLD